MTRPFDQLDRRLQRFVWHADWETLRPIQSDAIEVILETSRDLLLSAPTASGKTEAAFLPILSAIADDSPEGVRALYVAPLKALVDDQFERLDEELCRYADIPLYRWHGDVSASHKQNLVDDPGGVLLITPESIESIVANRSRYLERLFGSTDFAIVDELHAFMGTERGAHLKSLLARLDRLRDGRMRRVGLSATLGPETEAPKRWFGETPEEVELVQQDESGECRVVLHGYEKRPVELEEAETSAPSDLKLARDIDRTMRRGTNLVFGNRKARLESIVDRLGRIHGGEDKQDVFAIHHGSLDASVREATEASLRSDDVSTTVLCTNTLELGIDIGSIETVGQIGPPRTVESLAQRVGRSGRNRGDPCKLRCFIQEESPETAVTLADRLHPRLLQTVAMVRLYLEGWCEPLRPRRHHSTLVQQILSVLKQTGGLRAAPLYDRLVDEGAFEAVDPEEFAHLLRTLGEHDLIEQIPGEGLLILGEAGEGIADHFEFYAAFQTQDRFDVRHGGERIGEVPPRGLESGSHLLLAGRRWEVRAIRSQAREIAVRPTRGRKPPSFGSGGLRDVHSRVRDTMRDVLLADETPSFCDETALELTMRARRAAREGQLDDRHLVSRGPHTVLFHWTGDRIARTVATAASQRGWEVTREAFGTTLTFRETPPHEVCDCLDALAQRAYDDLELARTQPREAKVLDKYDAYLPDDFLDRGYAHDHLDVAGTAEWASAVLDERKR